MGLLFISSTVANEGVLISFAVEDVEDDMLDAGERLDGVSVPSS